MPVLLRGNKAVLFIHIPKTGGSSLESKLESLGWREIFSIRAIPEDRLKYMRVSPQHFHGALLEKVFNFEEFSSIVAITRDPFTRFKSEYYWHFRNARERPKPDLWIGDTLAKARENPSLHDNHLRPQVDFLPQGVDVALFKLEEDGVHRAAVHICGRHEEPRPPKGLRSLLLKPRTESAKPRTEREKSSAYHPEIEAAFAAQRKVITDFYADDFARFGYDPAAS